MLAALAVWAQIGPQQDALLIGLARSTIQAEVLGTPTPKPTSRSKPQPVFVTIEQNGKILGCRGDLTTRTSSLEDEVILEARAATLHDPRYRPLLRSDLKGFLVTVTVVSKLDRIANANSLQPSEGLVLESGSRKGIVLPWEGKDPTVRLDWAYRKAGVPLNSSVVLYRMIATRCRG